MMKTFRVIVTTSTGKRFQYHEIALDWFDAWERAFDRFSPCSVFIPQS